MATVGYRFVCKVEVSEDAARELMSRGQAEADTSHPLETGEIPGFVAGACSDVALSVPVAITCLAVVLIGIAGLCFLRQRVDIINQIPMDNSSEVLAAKAREIAKSLGYAERPVDTSFGWDYNEDYLRYVGAPRGLLSQSN